MGEINRSVPAGKQIQEDVLEELQQRATKDILTGLLNRATMEQCIKERMEMMTQEETCALFIVDLDNFKQVNDTLGHMAGDQAIRQSGRILSSLFRASDIVGRLGGDEFAIFLSGQITEELAREKAAAICENLHLVMGDHEVVNVTASVGVHLSGKGQKFEGLYQAADLALYKAKKTGKHRFCLKNQDGYQEAQSADFRPVNSLTLSSLLEKMESGVALLEMGETPQVIYVSPSFCRIIGGDPETYPLPKALADLIHPDDQVSLIKALWEGLHQGRVVEHTHRVCAADGQSWLWWQIRAAKIEYDSVNPVMLVTTMDISCFKETLRRQEDRIRLLQTAFDQTSKRLWEVDLQTREFRAYSRGGESCKMGEEPKRFPDDLIDGGWIHPNSVTRMRVFAEELLSGHAQGFGNFAIRSGNTGYYSWVSISYRMLFDDVGRAVRAVGIMENLPQDKPTRGGWSPDPHRMPEGLMAGLLIHMRANLDQDTIEALWIEGTDLSERLPKSSCSEFLRTEKKNVFHKGNQKSDQANFDRERLLREFQMGNRWFCAEYRRADGGGNVRWVRQVLYLTRDLASGQVTLFFYLLCLDPENQLRPVLYSEAKRDAVTKLYDRETVQRLAETIFSIRKGGNRAVAVLQINGLTKQTSDSGADSERLRYTIAAALSLILGGSCILGQYSIHQFVIVFPNVTEKEELRRRMDEMVTTLRRILAEEASYDSLRFLVGIGLMPAATANYLSMLAQAVRVCAFWWNAASDTVAFTQEREDWNWTQLRLYESDDQVSIHSAEMERPLSEQEKDVALDCVSAMLTAKTLEASVVGALQTVGVYYRADRVYTLAVVENRQAVIMTFEWTRANKRSIQQVISGVSIDRFPLLKRCMAERAPVFLTRRFHGAEEDGAANSPWHFTAFPLIRDQEVMGFLCVENAREHPSDAALFSTLIPFVLLQRERFSGGERSAGTTEQLMDLPDVRAYMEALYTLTSEYYSSMGAVCLDIPDLAAINSRMGFEYSGKMLWYVAKTLTDLFGSALLFRVSEAEFIIFYPNTTREVFLGRCGRLRSILQRRYPKQVRIGRAWSDGVFAGKRLAKEAKAAMRMNQSDLSADTKLLVPQMGEMFPFGDMVHDGQFIVYFQPKIDMRTGAMAGAEALVRGVGEDGSIIPPSKFIDLLEEDGAIRELDLFVLDQALAQVERWRSAGKGVVPIAVNLSRVTVAHPSTLASVLAIQSRYPQVPASALELEITERGGELETSELKKIVDRFHDCGLRLSLDDFGSQYANLSLFTNVKFDVVKLDRSIVTDVVGNPMDRTLVQDIVRLCRTNGIRCVAEGVETREHVNILLEMGCPYAQGYYYDKPLPAKEFEEKYLPDAATEIDQ